MTDVFISYSRKNTDFARKIFDSLVTTGRDLWVDWEDIPLTSDWWQEIQAGIEGAESFVFIASFDSLSSPICNMELNHALQHHKRIIPVIHQDIEFKDTLEALLSIEMSQLLQAQLHGQELEQLAQQNWTDISHLNWIFFREQDDFDEAFRDLVSAIETDLEHVKTHTRYYLRAREWQYNNNRTDFLLLGDEITHAENWVASSANKQPPVTALHRDYIKQSRIVENKRKQLLRNLRIASVVFGIVGVVAIVLTVLAIQEQRDANQRENIANTQVADTLLRESLANTQIAEAQVTLEFIEVQIAEQEAIANSLRLSGVAQAQAQQGNNSLALALALESAKVENVSLQIQQTLADIVFAPGIRSIFSETAEGTFLLEFSPDGNLLLSLSDELLLWDVQTGEIVQRFNSPDAGLRKALFSPDGTTILTGGDQLLLWDVQTGEILQEYEGLSTPLSGLAISPDGIRFATSGTDIQIWNMETATVEQRFTTNNFVSNIDFSPEGDQLVSGGANLILWDIASGEQLFNVLDEAIGILDVEFSPDEQTIAYTRETYSADPFPINIANRYTGEIDHYLEVFLLGTPDLNYSPDGKYLVGVDSFEGLRLWDTSTFTVQETLLDNFTSVAFHPNDFSVALANEAGEIIIWDILPAPQYDEVIHYDGWVFDLEYSPDGKTIAVTGCIPRPCTSYMSIWDIETQQWRYEFYDFEDTFGSLESISYSPDSRYIIADNGVIWDVETGEYVRNPYSNEESDFGFVEDLYYANLHPTEPYLLLDDGTLLNYLTDEVITTYSGLGSFSPDGEYLYLTSGDILATSNNEVILELSEPGTFSPNNQYALTNLGEIWDIQSGELLRTLTPLTVFSADSLWAASVAQDSNIITIWNMATDVSFTLSGHAAPVNHLAFSPDNQFLASASQDSSVILWDVVKRESFEIYFHNTTNWVDDVEFSPDGTHLLSSSCALATDSCVDVEIVQWRIDTLSELMNWAQENRLIQEFTCDERISFQVEPYCES